MKPTPLVRQIGNAIIHVKAVAMGIAFAMCTSVCAYEALVFRGLDVTDGMTGSYIRCTTSDVYGQMWFLTMNGVNRFDGYRFYDYRLSDSPYWADALHELFATADSLLWVTGDRSNYVYHPREDYFDSHATEQLFRYGMEGDIRQLFPDADGNLWAVRADVPCLYHYDYATCRLASVPLPAGDRVLGICRRDDRVTLLLTSADGISQLFSIAVGSSSLTLRRMASVPRPLGEGATLYADTRGRIWIYFPHKQGILCYDELTCQWCDLSDSADFAGKLITCMADDGEGNLWIGTGNAGVRVLDPKDNLLAVGHAPSSSSMDVVSTGTPLTDNHIASLYADTLHHTLWIGTSKQGIVYADLVPNPIRRIMMPDGEDVSCLVHDETGTLWMGFDSQGIGYVSSPAQPLTHLDVPLPSSQIVCTLIDSRDRHWWGSYGGNLFWIGSGGRVTVVDDERLRYVISLAEDCYGHIWAAGFANGLFCLDADAQHVVATYNTSNSILGTNSLTKIIASPDGHLYIASSYGLFVLDIETGRMDKMLGGNVRTICLDGDILWVGMGGDDVGLVAIDLRTGENTILTTVDGLSHNTVSGIVADRFGTIWVSTLDGITRVIAHDAPDGSRSYACVPYKGDGSSTEHIAFNLDAITRMADGDILMGGLGVLVHITPDRVSPAADDVWETRFVGLSLGGQRVEVGKPWTDGRVLLPQSMLSGIRSLTLRYSDINIAFDLSAMHYTDCQSLRYQYRLSDRTLWQTLDAGTLLLSSLTPGTYDVQVRAVAASRQMTGPVTHLRLVITPPWWQSRLAYVIYALCFICAVVLVVWLSQRRHRHRMEQERREMAVSQQREMAEAKMRFFTNVSHDMRTPLSLIITPLQHLLGGDLEPSVRTQLEIISRSAETLMDEVTQLLDFRKLDESLETATLVVGSLTGFIRQACSSFTQNELPGGVTLSLDLCDDPLIMPFDHRKMRRILFNLVSNAIKYNRPGGTVTIHTDVTPVSSGSDGSRQAILQVIDTGIGIRRENRERIFDRFYQEEHADDTTYIGSGIGLHLVKQYVLMHKGTIAVDAVEPQGTVFTITFPLAETEAKADPEAASDVRTDVSTSAGQDVQTATSATLLIVEDNNDFRLFLQSCLIDHYHVLLAADGREALAQLDGHEVDIIISDVMMPVMDGTELCRAVKGDLRYSHIPFIMLTARTADEHQIHGLQDGADDYITKPFNLDVLLLRIQRLLRRTREAPERFRKMDVSPAEITVSHIDRQLIEQAIAIVEHHMAEVDFSVEQLCDELGMSRSNLYKKLMAITGLSPLHFIRTLRIKRGRQLLEQGGYQVSQVAYQIGFSPKQFAKYFKEEYGLSPSDLASMENCCSIDN